MWLCSVSSITTEKHVFLLHQKNNKSIKQSATYAAIFLSTIRSQWINRFFCRSMKAIFISCTTYFFRNIFSVLQGLFFVMDRVIKIISLLWKVEKTLLKSADFCFLWCIADQIFPTHTIVLCRFITILMYQTCYGMMSHVFHIALISKTSFTRKVSIYASILKGNISKKKFIHYLFLINDNLPFDINFKIVILGKNKSK